MSRTYSVSFTDVAVSAVQDLFEVLCGAGKSLVLEEITLGQRSDFGDAEAEGLTILIKRGAVGYTSGSGGTVVVPAKHVSSDTASGATAEVNNTTQASGSITTLLSKPFNVQGEFDYFPVSGKTGYTFLAGEACIVSISSAPADALTMSGTLTFTEYD